MTKRQIKLRKVKKPNAFQKILRSSKNQSSRILHNTINNLAPRDIINLSKQIAKHPTFLKLFLPKKNSFINYYYNNNKKNFSLQLDRLLIWVESILFNSSEVINEFVRLEADITKYILNNNYIEALEIVELIESKYGSSMWGVQTKSYLLSKVESIEAANEYVTSQISKSSSNLINYFLNSLTTRIQDDNIYFSKNRELNQKIEEVFFDDVEFLSLLKYKLLPNEYAFGFDSQSILKYELGTSIIDLYKSLIFCLSNEIFNNSSDSSHWLKISKNICRYIDDPILRSLSFSLGNIELTESMISDEQIHLIDCYTKGEYCLAIKTFDTSQQLLKSFNAFEIACKSTIRCKNKKFNHFSISQVEKFQSILLSDNSFKQNELSLFNESFCLNSLNWFANQHIFLKLNTQNLNVNEKLSIQRLYFSRSDLFSAFKCKFLNKDNQKYVLDILNRKTLNSESLKLFELYSNNKQNNKNEINALDIELNRKNKFIAMHLFNLGEYKMALEYYETMYGSDDSITKIESIQGLITTLIQVGELQQAAKRFCESYINDRAGLYFA